MCRITTSRCYLPPGSSTVLPSLPHSISNPSPPSPASFSLSPSHFSPSPSVSPASHQPYDSPSSPTSTHLQTIPSTPYPSASYRLRIMTADPLWSHLNAPCVAISNAFQYISAKIRTLFIFMRLWSLSQLWKDGLLVDRIFWPGWGFRSIRDGLFLSLLISSQWFTCQPPMTNMYQTWLIWDPAPAAFF